MSRKIKILLFPFAAFALCLAVSKVFIFLIEKIHYHCIINLVTGMICPGCGATRALKYLLNLDFVSSLRCNPLIILSAAALAVIYLQFFLNEFVTDKKIIPENKAFYFVVSGIIFVYLIARNFVPFLQPL